MAWLRRRRAGALINPPSKLGGRLFCLRCFFFLGCGGFGFEIALVADLVGARALDAHQLAHVSGVAFEEDSRTAEMTLLLGVAGASEMGGERVAALELAGGGHLESLGDGLVGFVLVSHVFP